MTRTKSLMVLVVKCLISGGLLYLLLRRLDWPHLLAASQSLSLAGWSGAFALYLLAQCLSSLRWCMIAQRFALTLPFMHYLKSYFIGIFFNLFLPTGVGGDIVKGYHLGKHSGQMVHAAYTVILDRVLGLVMLLILGAYAAWYVDLTPRWLQHLLVLGAVSGVGAVLLAPYVIGVLGRLHTALAAALAQQRFFWRDWRTLLRVSVLSCLVQLLTVLAIFAIGRQLHIDQPVLFYMAGCAIIAIVSLTPVTINGFGLREWGFVALFQGVGVSEEVALLLSLLSFSLQCAAGLLGLIPFLAQSNTNRPVVEQPR